MFEISCVNRYLSQAENLLNVAEGRGFCYVATKWGKCSRGTGFLLRCCVVGKGSLLHGYLLSKGRQI